MAVVKVQSVPYDNGFTGGTSSTATFTSALTSGSKVIVACAVGANVALSATDSVGNTYTSVTQRFWANVGSNIAILYADNTSSASSVVVTIAHGGGTQTLRAGSIQEWTGLATGAPDTFTAGANQTGNTTITDVSMTTTVAGDLIFTIATSDGSTLTAGAGFTLINFNSSSLNGSEFQIQGSAGSITPTFSQAAAVQGIIASAAFAPSGGGGATTVDGWTPLRPGFMVGAAFPQFMQVFSAPFSSDGSVTLAADGTASITLSASGAAAASSSGTGSLSLSATGAATTPATGTGSLTLGGSGTAQATAAGAGSLTLSGAGAATAPAAGTGSITFSATGTATAQGAASGTGSLTLSASGSTSAPAAGTGSITLSATGTATGGGQATGTGSITLSATGATTSPSSGTGAISLTGSGTAASPAAGSGSLTLTGTGTASQGGGGTGTLTLVGAGTGRAVTVSTASLSLSAAGAIAATAGGTAQLVLSAAGTAVNPSAVVYNIYATADPPQYSAAVDSPQYRSAVDPPEYVSRT